ELPREFGADAEPADIAACTELPAPSRPRQRARPDDRVGPQLARPQRQLRERRVRGVEGDGRAQMPEPETRKRFERECARARETVAWRELDERLVALEVHAIEEPARKG